MEINLSHILTGITIAIAIIGLLSTFHWRVWSRVSKTEDKLNKLNESLLKLSSLCENCANNKLEEDVIALSSRISVFEGEDKSSSDSNNRLQEVVNALSDRICTVEELGKNHSDSNKFSFDGMIVLLQLSQKQCSSLLKYLDIAVDERSTLDKFIHKRFSELEVSVRVTGVMSVNRKIRSRSIAYLEHVPPSRSADIKRLKTAISLSYLAEHEKDEIRDILGTTQTE